MWNANPNSIIGISPFEVPDSAVVAALCRAGVLGVLDLGRDERRARRALGALAAEVSTSFGVRVPEGVEASPTWLPPQASLVILPNSASMDSWRSLTIFVQVTSVQEAQTALAAGAAGLIAKGSESGGCVGDEASFILLQQLIREGITLPIWVQGGIGMHTAAACIAGGATGVVLDSQLALLAESCLPTDVKQAVRAMDGSETTVLHGIRVYTRPDLTLCDRGEADRSVLLGLLGAKSLTESVIPAGQDAAFASTLADRHRTVSALVAAMTNAVNTHLSQAKEMAPLSSNSPMAIEHNTTYPILQGPMTRVSDQAEFASAVSDGGALPFLALALMRGEQVRALVSETAERLADRSWGVGILGFVPPSLRDEQLAILSDIRPPFAIIAGGRPAQARELEANGTKTYLHVPSPGLLDLFLQEGARRFIFEGRECGGHVGPRSSFVLWNMQIERLLAFDQLEDVSVVFAGGIHDAQSAAMVAAMAAPLAARGAHVGVLMGTAYLFTQEAVDTGAILPGYQEAVIGASDTVLLETAPGHATRCLKTGYVDDFGAERERLLSQGLSSQEVWAALEQLNVGRLRIAAKGIRRGQRQGEKQKLVSVSDEVQRREGMFMVGQVASLRSAVTTISELHAEVCDRSNELLTALVRPEAAEESVVIASPMDVAIIGMACIFPKAPNKDAFWANVVAGENAITEVSRQRWDPDIYYDPNSLNGEKTPSKWGGFLDPVPFDPLEYGIPPKSLESIEPIQLLSLQVARDALDDAGYGERSFNRTRTSVIFGAEAGAELAGAYGFRAVYPQLVGDLSPALESRLPSLTEDSFPGVLANVIAGRIANRLDFGGVNYTVDAACASSLAAVDLAVKELSSGTSDMVLCGGADLHNSINDYLLFSSVHALSPSGQCRSFDHQADGIVLGEGVAVVVLKRLVDAERDGDRVYAVVKGLGGSSDGRSLGLTAPRSDGQVRALQRAYETAGISPATVGLMEAHGTGTVVGDKTELETIERVLKEAGAATGSCALGSVKSNIGHTKCAAGMAGLIKSALAIHHRVLPATLNVDRPNPAYDADTSPFTLSDYSRPWVATNRCAGVSAFGFGGTNFHVVLSSHGCGTAGTQQVWPAELFLFRGEDMDAVAPALEALCSHVKAHPFDLLVDLAYTVYEQGRNGAVQVAIVAADHDELIEALEFALEGQALPNRVFLADGLTGDVAFLFPGQGSQRAGMMADLFVLFPELHHYLRLGESWRDTLYPPTAFDSAQRKAQKNAITDTRVAQPTLGMVDLATASVLERFGIRPDMVAGHSYGELVALCAAGVLTEADLFPLSERRGQAILAAAGDDPGTMAAVSADANSVAAVLADSPDVVIANMNAPEQTVISGPVKAVEAVIDQLREAGLSARTIPVACAFHSPVVAGASTTLGDHLSTLDLRAPKLPVWSNTTTEPYSNDPTAIRALLARHVAEPVRFAEQIQNMYDAGARVFVEVGPGRVLTGLVGRTLGDQAHVAVPCSADGRGHIADLLATLGKLAVHGIPVRAEALFEARVVTGLDLSAGDTLSPTTWLVNGHLAWPASEEAPKPAEPVGATLTPPMVTSGVGAPQDADKSTVVLEYLKNMRQLVADQRDVLLGYLGATSSVRPVEQSVTERALSAPSAERPSVVETIPPDQDECVEDILIGIVSERTGYPPQMLDLDLDLEAALSIDSIKRIEILGALGETLGMSSKDGGPMEELVEELAAVKTLRGILDWLEAHQATDSEPSAEATDTEEPLRVGGEVDGVSDMPIGRYLFQVQPAPPLTFNGLSVDGRSFAITRDQHGVAEHLCRLLQEHGAQAEIVPLGESEWTYDGVIHLATLTPDPVETVLCRVFESVRDSLLSGAFWVVGASGLGGAFGRRENGSIPPTGAGLAGLLKSVAVEWPDARIRAVDLNVNDDPALLAKYLFDELLANDGLVEVGYCDKQRRVLHAVPAARNTHQAVSTLMLDTESVVLVTGGARGITAHAAIALAKRYGCHFELMGRTLCTLEAYDAELAAADDLISLRKILINRAETTDVVAIEKESRRILAVRAIGQTLNAIRDAGGTTSYHAVDVRDAGSFGAIVDDIYERHGRIDGVIHGAGIIEDQLLRHKTGESFSRVYETKVCGAHTLVTHLREDVGFVAFFSSVSGAFGNRGQVDYAAANDALDKLALSLNESIKGRVVSINWGPWGGAGMVSSELQKEYERRGISLIELEKGMEAFLEELEYGAAEDAQVVLMRADLEHMLGRDG
jgi:acyl transferase domain-containing protein/NAD(P)H-dependent flavin oxidoreductase YrpB (nitropropane dioxygenase family)/NAD(P)-dependent dehydrogenase (short-subunit alcohol dehydrogenase family)